MKTRIIFDGEWFIPQMKGLLFWSGIGDGTSTRSWDGMYFANNACFKTLEEAKRFLELFRTKRNPEVVYHETWP